MKESIKPNGFRLLLFFTFLVPVFVAMDTLRLPPVVQVVVTLPSGYLLACFTDRFVGNKKIKIAFASLLALASLVWILYYTFSRSVVVYDPVHRPSECELLCRKIIENTTNVTEEVIKKFSECVQNCRLK